MSKKTFLKNAIFTMVFFFTITLSAQIEQGTISSLNAKSSTDSKSSTNSKSTDNLTPLYSVTGQYFLSVDGVGSPSSSMNVRINKPSAGATVHKAFLFSVTVPNQSAVTSGCVTINGSGVNWDGSIKAVLNTYNHWADVTSLVTSSIDAMPAGISALPITECNEAIDGNVLLVIFNEDIGTDETVAILWGAQNSAGDNFNISLNSPIDPTDPESVLDMGIGISFGYQGGDQYSIIDVNGTRLTTSAGGQDDGSGFNGALITVGGIGDSNANPSDPYALPINTRSDDELYSLLPFIDNQTTSLTAFTQNPSNDDNIFLAYFVISGSASVATVCPEAVTVDNEYGTCGATVNYLVTEGSIQTGGLPSGSVFPVGTTTNTFTNPECSFIVTVVDSTNPNTPTLADVTGQCSATAAVPTTTDNCAGTINGTTTDPLTYAVQGTHEITWSFDDGNGNVITVKQNVIVNDTTAPNTPTLADVTGQCSATAAVPTTTDNCAGTINGTTSDPLTYSTQGTHTITWNFNDGNGQNYNVTQNVIVEDNTIPTVSTQDKSVFLDVNGNASLTIADINDGSYDNCSIETLKFLTSDGGNGNQRITTVTNGTRSGRNITGINYLYGGETKTLTLSNAIKSKLVLSTLTAGSGDANRFWDANGGTMSESKALSVLGDLDLGTALQDCSDPAGVKHDVIFDTPITPGAGPEIFIVHGGLSQSIQILDTDGNVALTIASSQGSSNVVIGGSNVASSFAGYYLRNNVNFQVQQSGSHGNSQNKILALDINPSEVTKIGGIRFGGGGGCNYTYEILGFQPEQLTTSELDFTCDNLGTNTITLQATDATGNSSTATATVTVLDEMLPAITAPADITNVIATSAQGAVVNYTTPVGTDNCSVTTAMTAGLADGSTFPIGITVVTYVATDGSGNIASVSFNVEVVGIAPVIVIPADITVNNDLGECGAIVPFAATDVTGIPNSVISYNIQPNSFFAVGTTIVTASATNASGTSTGTFSVTVSDNEDPVLGTIPSDITVECDAVPTASAADVSATDNCDGSPIVTYLEVRTDGVSVNNYILTRTWTATDVAENSAFKRQEITVEDTTIPVITLVGSNPQIIDINTSYLELSATAIDNCDGDITANIAIDYSAVDLTTIGSYIVTYAVSDASGNPAVQKTRTVFILEPGKPWAQDDTYEVAKNSSNNTFRIIENDSYGTDGANADHAISLSGTYTGTGGKLDLEDSTVKYTPRTGYVGADSFSYIITDQNGDASTGYVTINVLELTTPVANTDYVDIIQNSSNNSIDVLANDSFGTDGPASVGSLTVSGTSLEGGSLSINNDKVMYTPLVNFFGDDSFSYTIKDATGETASATVTVNVTEATAVSVPTAEKDVFNVDQNSSNTIMNVLADNGFGVDDFGADGPIDGGLTFTNGLLEGESDRGGVIRITNKSTLSPLDDEILYTPKVGFVGEDGFKYMITDTSGDTSITTVIVTVTEIATPTAVADGITVLEDSGIISIDVLANDSFGSDGPAATDSLVVSSATSTQGSTIAVNSGKIDYTPALGFSGTDTFEYTIKDGTDDDTSTATVTITVEAAGTGNVPTAEDDSVSVTQDSGVNLINILDDNGFGVDFYGSDGPNADHPISLYAFYTDNGGELELDGNVVKYTPRTGYVGIDTFKYTLTDLNGDADVATVTITVEALPLLLTALDDFYTVSQDSGATNLEVLDNDTLLAGASITFFEVVSVHGGAVSLDDNGTVADATDDFLTYTPSSGYSGADSFTYTIGVGVDSSSATVTVTVESAVVVTGVLAAKKDAFTVIQNSIDTAFNVLADNGSGADSYGASGPKDGGLTLINGMLIGATEQGNVTIDAKGTPSPLDDSIVYTPNASYVGVDHFYYMITTVSGNTAIAQVTITVNPATPANGFPTAVDDEVSVLQNSADNSINILDDNGFGIDDYGTDGPHVDHPISLSGTYTDNGGKLELDGTTVKYTPRVGYIGVDQFGYILTDASGDASTAEVTVNVTASAVSTKVGSKSLIKELTVYPNPTKGNLNVLVFSDKTEQVSIVLFDVTGKVIYNKKQELKVGKNTMNLNVNISAGFLFLKVYSNSMDFGTEKVFFN